MSGYRTALAALSVLLLSLPFWIDGPVLDLARRRHPLHPDRAQPPVEGRVLLVGGGPFHGVGVPDGEGLGQRLGVRRRTAVRLHGRDALRQLPSWLAVDRPSVVLLGLGADDLAVEPTVWTEAEAEVLSAWTGRGIDATQLATLFLGRWRWKGLPFVFEPSGRAQIGERVGTWTFDGDELAVEDEEGRAVWVPSLEGELLVLSPIGGGEGQIECVPESLAETALQRAIRCIDEGRLAEWDLRAPSASRGEIPEPLFQQGRAWVETLRGSGSGAWPSSYAQAAPLAAEAAEQLERTLEDLVRTVRRAGAEPILLGHSSAFADRNVIARRVATQLEVRFVEAPGNESGLVHAPAPGYWTAAGHEAWAESLKALLER